MTWLSVRRRATELVRSYSAVHRPDGKPDVFLFTTPRSGSTWLMEVLCSQPGFKGCSEPFDLRNPSVRRHLGISDWETLYSREALVPVETYIEGLRTGRLRFMNPRPSLTRPRLVTRRIVFKVLHACEDRIGWFRERFRAHVVLLLRHPIPVSLSREVHPRLLAFLDSDYSRHLSAEQLRFARQLASSGSHLEKGVLDWALQNFVPLRDAEPEWFVTTYEQLLLDPKPVVSRLAEAFDLPSPSRMVDALHEPSRTTNKSDSQTARLLKQPESRERTHHLLERWRSKVGTEEERRVMDILKRFEIDVYAAGSALPVGRFAP